MGTTLCLDGNDAVARVAHALSEVIAIYPITPASPMGEASDTWSAAGRTNLWGGVPEVMAMQSEAGAAGTLHGASLKGGLATTFTSSQGLLLMLPNLFKLAGELSPAVVHVAARALATHALSIFGDHSDVMAARTTGMAMLCSSSVQEAHDMAAVAHAVALRSRVPVLHFFDGFRTSHEMNRIEVLDDHDLLALVREEDIAAHRLRGLDPDRPVLRGSAQNPDVFFQAREAANPFHDAVPGAVETVFADLAARTGRRYGLVEYRGHPEAERALVMMGSGVGAAGEAIDALVASGERVGLLTVRLYRPFPSAALLAALPASVGRVAVLDRTKEPGSVGEPLYLDVVGALVEAHTAGDRDGIPRVIGARYGLGSKEFTPAHVKGLFDELAGDHPRAHVTVGIVDDVTHTSVDPDPAFLVPTGTVQAVFHGLGSDGTVGSTKATVKILGEHTDLHAQGYFVYDSRKAGAVTESHLRFGPDPIRSTYLIEGADFVAISQFAFLERRDVLARARPGATVLVNSPYGPDEVWGHLPVEVQQEVLDKGLVLHVIDADRVAREAGMGNRINTVMQPCFFALSGVLEPDRALAAIRAQIERTYAKAGPAVIERNLAAVDAALGALAPVPTPTAVTATFGRPPVVPDTVPDFVERITARLLAGEGDLLPVSALPVDGAFPTDTARWEKRALASELPIWDPSLCIDCGKCAIVCPHAAIRMKVMPPEDLDGAPEGFRAKDFRSRDLPDHRLVIQVAPDDCTGCGVCVQTCPAHSKEQVKHKALNMAPAAEHREAERLAFDFFLDVPELPPTALAPGSVKGSQVRQPLFEFSGACAGCGETPYLKLISQLFGDHMVVANATGCSSIYGGNLPTTPWSTDADGRGPAWANSLFEDNAEFGLGFRLALDQHEAEARRLVEHFAPELGDDLVRDLLAPQGRDDGAVAARRVAVAALQDRLEGVSGDRAARLRALAGDLVTRSVWIVGGDGWAYDIGFGGVDHVLSSGRNVNLLVLDTEVYSNTGGQASKATPRGAVAKFASAGRRTAKKDLGDDGRAYGDVYVAQVAMGANDVQTVKALLEADAWPGPSLVIAYSPCVAHGIDMSQTMVHMRDAVHSGHWPLYRYKPGADEHEHPFQLDSHVPDKPFREFAMTEGRFAMLTRSDPERAETLFTEAQADVDERWRYYEQLAGVERTMTSPAEEEDPVTDLTTSYLGLSLRSPIVASSSPVTGDPEGLRRLDDAGVGAVVLPSLFEEQIEQEAVEVDRMLATGSEAFGEAAGYFPELDTYNTGPDRYLAQVAEAKAILSVPVIASLNATSSGGWVRYGRLLADAGADAVELNANLVATDLVLTGTEVEAALLTMVTDVLDAVEVPVAVKLGPYWSSLGHLAARLSDLGVAGLVLFNRPFAPDLELDTLEVVPRLTLSEPDDLFLSLRWIGLLEGRITADLAATSGVHDAAAVAKALLAGADVAMMASALLRHGPGHVATVLADLRAWMVDRAYHSVDQLRGSVSARGVADPAAYVRANYLQALTSYSSPFPT